MDSATVPQMHELGLRPKYSWIYSRGAHAAHSHGQYDALVEFEREVWIAPDGSGFIKDLVGPTSFFNTAGEQAWRDTGSPSLFEGRSQRRFPPGSLGSVATGRIGDEHLLTELRDLDVLLGENVLLPEDLRRIVVEAATKLPGVRRGPRSSDSLGRTGTPLYALEDDAYERKEVLSDSHDLLETCLILTRDQPYAPAGTVVSHTVYVAREMRQQVPDIAQRA